MHELVEGVKTHVYTLFYRKSKIKKKKKNGKKRRSVLEDAGAGPIPDYCELYNLWVTPSCETGCLHLDWGERRALKIPSRHLLKHLKILCFEQ